MASGEVENKNYHSEFKIWLLYDLRRRWRLNRLGFNEQVKKLKGRQICWENKGTDIKECEDGWEELVNLVLGRWLRAAQQQAASYEPRNNSPRLSMICLLLQPGLCSSSMSVADWSTCWTNFEIFKRKFKAISMEILSDGGLWRLVLVRFFN